MFNETAYPIVKSMNPKLRKKHLTEFENFTNKTVGIEHSETREIKDGGLFCLVDFYESNKVYIFTIQEFNKANNIVVLKSLVKLDKERWKEIGGNPNVRRTGIVQDPLLFINGIKNILYPNYENPGIIIKLLRDKLKMKRQEIRKIKEVNRLEIQDLINKQNDKIDTLKKKNISQNGKYEHYIKSIQDNLDLVSNDFKELNVSFTDANDLCEELSQKLNSQKQIHEREKEKYDNQLRENTIKIQETCTYQLLTATQKYKQELENEKQLIIEKYDTKKERLREKLNMFYKMFLLVMPPTIAYKLCR